MDSMIPISENKEVKKKKKGKGVSKKGKKSADDDTTKSKKKKGTKKNKKSKKNSEYENGENEIPKPIVGEKTITIPNNQSNLVKMDPVSIHSSLASIPEQRKTKIKKVNKKKIPSNNELINQYLPIQFGGKIISLVYKWEFTNEPNIIHIEFILKNNIENEKIKIIKFEIAETMKAHIINLNNKLPLTIPAKQTVSIEKNIMLLSSTLISDITIPASIQYQDLSVDPKNYQESFKLSLPLTIYMKKPNFPITPDYFVEIISDPEKITQNAVVKITFPSNISQEQIQSIVKYTSEDLLKLHVVEVVNGAATLVGQTVQGNIVAALLKQTIKKNNDIVLSLNIKGDNDELVNGLADIARKYLQSLKK